jgi:hypothetical protein
MDRDRGMDRDRDKDMDRTGTGTRTRTDVVIVFHVKPPYGDISIPYAYCTVRPCTVQRLYVNHSTVSPLYGTRSHRTVGVRYGHDILKRSFGDTVFQIMPIRLDDANSIVLKTLKRFYAPIAMVSL